MVEYKYDAWSKIIGRTGSLVSTLGYLNPFRYRGYVYDEETGLYYLRSRYYNPEWGRFINADVVMGKQGVLLGHNLFAYCANAPVLFKDDYGYAMVCAFDDCGFGNSAASLTSISMSGGGGGVWNVYAYADSTHRRGGQSIEKEYLAVCEGISVFAKIAVTGYIAWKIGAVAGLLGQGIFDEAILQGFGAVIGRGMQAMTMASGAAISIGINEAIGTIVWNEESEPMTWMKLGREVAESFVPSVSGVVASRLKWSKKLTDRLEYWEGVFKEIIINAIYDD